MNHNDIPRGELLLPPDWGEEMLDALNAFPGGLKFVLNGWEETGEAVRGTNMLGAMMQFPALAKAFLTYNNQVVVNSTISAREREIIILRLGWLCQCEYEHVMHLILGRRAGLSEEEILRIEHGPDAAGWQNQDGNLVRLVDELLNDKQLSDSTWQALRADYSNNQIMDMIFLVGCYQTLAMYMKTFKIPLEASEAPLPDDVRERMYSQNH